MLTGIFRVSGGISLVVGAFLLALNVSGFFYLPDRHSKTLNTERTKAGISLQSPVSVLTGLGEIKELSGENDIRRVTELFSAGVMHYWPGEDGWDREILTDFRENWVTALIERVELYLLESGRVSSPDYVRRERLDYENIVAKGVGLCSQVSLGVADFVRRLGEDAFVWSLSGHVVTVVGPLRDGQVYIVDGDYGVYLPFSPEEIEKEPGLIRPAYLQAGYPSGQVETLVDIYGSEGNFEYGTELSWKVVTLQWALPVVMILISLPVFWFTRRSRRNRSLRDAR